MKRLLILSYYFPPLGQSGVQRALKLVKYLPRYGWQPVVVTPGASGRYAYDSSLLGEVSAPVYRTFSLDPRYLSSRRHDPGQPARRRFPSAVNRWFVPDNKIGWIPFAVRAGRLAARQHAVDAILSTAPPYSSHLAGVILKRVLGKPLICDFRDAWTRYTWADYPTALHRALDQWLESRCVSNSDLVLGVNQTIIDELRRAHQNAPASRFRLLSHGYDPEDFQDDVRPDPDHFTIVHTGTFINNRGPAVLLNALRILRSTAPEVGRTVRLVFAGASRSEDIALAQRSGLGEAVRFTGYVPHAESVNLLQRADALWMVMGREETANVTPGKLFEYLGARRPILASIPVNGAAARIIRKTGAGRVFPPDDSAALSEAIRGLILRRRSGETGYCALPGAVARYNRKLVARQLAAMLSSLTRTLR